MISRVFWAIDTSPDQNQIFKGSFKEPFLLPLNALNREGEGLTTPNTQAGNALLEVVLL